MENKPEEVILNSKLRVSESRIKLVWINAEREQLKATLVVG